MLVKVALRQVFLLLLFFSPVCAAPDIVGPFVGTVSETEAHLLFSPGRYESTLRLTVSNKDGTRIADAMGASSAENAFVAKFHVKGLSPGTTYRYKIEKVSDGEPILLAGGTQDYHFTTVSNERSGQVVTGAFVSCANDTSDPVWKEMAGQRLNFLCLGGDTPYVDTGNLAEIRKKHRHFLNRPGLASLGRNTSVFGTWDDHDFGQNGGNGKSAASLKINTRRGFVEYRAHSQFGNGSEGVYHKVDMGAMEIFLLDPRWFSQTDSSPVTPGQSTCFGKAQWAWLLHSLRDSKAPFKILLQGQIWQDKKNSETDDMHTYWAERDALFDHIKTEKIPGVVLVGGDIHVSRYLMHPQRVGYDLHDFVISPAHTGVIKSLNVYHPDLEWSRAESNQFLTLTADTTKEVPELTARFLDAKGNENLVKTLSYDHLTPPKNAGLAKDLRAHWSFDGHPRNASKLGARLHGVLRNGASLVETGGKRGGALKLTRSGSQYLSVARGMLDDNAGAFTVSCWVKPSSLPTHHSKDRSFIIESRVNNHCKLPKASTTGYAISLGFRTSDQADKINLQLYTETLVPQPPGSQRSPGSRSLGGFDCSLDRSLFSDWTHVVATFDSENLRLYLNGSLKKTHVLPTVAPIAETGGLIIGGHRSGEGRNFDGMIDEVAIWNRTLNNIEVEELFGSGL